MKKSKDYVEKKIEFYSRKLFPLKQYYILRLLFVLVSEEINWETLLSEHTFYLYK